MTISVIIPTLHEEKTLPGTLARLRHPAFSEVLVVDGGSRDRTLAGVALANPLARTVIATRWHVLDPTSRPMYTLPIERLHKKELCCG